MKKVLVLALVVLLIGPLVNNLKAETIFLNFGVLTDDQLSFNPFFWYLGASLNLQMFSVFYFSPEVNLISYKFKFDSFWFDPAVMFNVKLGNFFAGAGLNKMWFISGTDWLGSTDWMLKLNAGLAGHNVRVLAFAKMSFKNMFKDMLVGAQFGIGF